MVDFGLSTAIKHRKREGANPIIAEIKVYSPKYGDLLGDRDPIDILRAYERAGVVGISYITEPKYFGGDFKLFRKICRETDLPVLRKDFITSKNEIERSAEAEASAVLIITRILGERTAEFVDYALEHGLETLVEVHSLDEIRIVSTSIICIKSNILMNFVEPHSHLSSIGSILVILPHFVQVK